MNIENTKKPSDQKRIRRQLYKLSNHNELSLDFVSALAGDRALSSGENKLFQRLSQNRGDLLYVDLLFILTHQYYPEETAQFLWNQILEHKKNVSKKLGRNIGITVAALDYIIFCSFANLFFFQYFEDPYFTILPSYTLADNMR